MINSSVNKGERKVQFHFDNIPLTCLRVLKLKTGPNQRFASLSVGSVINKTSIWFKPWAWLVLSLRKKYWHPKLVAISKRRSLATSKLKSIWRLTSEPEYCNGILFLVNISAISLYKERTCLTDNSSNGLIGFTPSSVKSLNNAPGSNAKPRGSNKVLRLISTISDPELKPNSRCDSS